MAFALCAINMHGQTINLMDSIATAFQQQPKIQFKLDSRNSFITGNNASVMGIKLGVEFGKTAAIGIGYNWMYTKMKSEIIDGIENTPVQADIVFRYIAPYFVYSFYQKNKWDISVPIQFGVGISRLQYTNAVGVKVKRDQGLIVLYEPAMVLEYAVLPFIGIGGGVGYRLMLKNNRSIDERFTAPTYKLLFSLKLGVLYNQLRARGSIR